MTKLLDQAIAKARELPEEEQDALALAILADLETEIEPLDDETRVAIREGLEQARRGEFVPDEEMEAFWKRHRLEKSLHAEGA
jgi:predicted transcriptional regulator